MYTKPLDYEASIQPLWYSRHLKISVLNFNLLESLESFEFVQILYFEYKSIDWIKNNSKIETHFWSDRLKEDKWSPFQV